MIATPWLMLAGLLTIVMVVWFADRVVSRGRARRLRRLAERCGFRYSSVDRFCLAARLRNVIAGDVVVRDLMYRSDAGGYVYAFTAVSADAGRGRFVFHAREAASDCTLLDIKRGDVALPLGEQYRRLLHESLPPADAA
ncbi:MAG: hypothetical protein JWM57_539 [Phycisphaerales bacterium]|nr:hypothetical protein [Phycisphaerales bacterium]